MNTPEPLPRYWYVEAFLEAAHDWGEKDRRRAVTLLRMCSKHVGAYVAGLLLQEPVWLDRMKIVDDEVRLSRAMRDELNRRLKEAGRSSLGSLEATSEWFELCEREGSELETRGLSRVVYRAGYFRPSIARRLRKLALAADTSEVYVIASLWFLLDRPDCIRGTKVVERSIRLTKLGESLFPDWLRERYPTVRPAASGNPAPATNEPT